jgi:hypothetical protein
VICSFYPGAQLPFRQLDAQELTSARIGGAAQKARRILEPHQGVATRERGARIGGGKARSGGAQAGAEQSQPMSGLRRGEPARAALRRGAA